MSSFAARYGGCRIMMLRKALIIRQLRDVSKCKNLRPIIFFFHFSRVFLSLYPSIFNFSGSILMIIN